MFRNSLLVCSIVAFILIACKKSADTSTQAGSIALDKKNTADNTPDYGDTVIYIKWKGPKKDFTIKPKKIKDPGKFVSKPQGLVLDAASGEINVSKSETGIRYQVGFVKANTQDTSFTTLVVGGITYLDGIYSMSTSDTLASPFYDANPVQAPVCEASDDTDYPTLTIAGADKCEFDDDEDLDSPNGKDDEPPAGQSANKKKLRVRKKSGVINLKKSLNDGIFGANPQNGDTKLVTIYYRLNDKSDKVLQSITIQVTYYRNKSDIPAATQMGILSMQQQFMQYTVVNGKPRPPQIVITR